MGGKNSYESIKRYQDKAYDKILVRLPKGQKDTIQAHAQAQGESANAFIGRAISETMERDSSSSTVSPQAPEMPQDGLLVLVEIGYDPIVGKPLYSDKNTGKQYTVEAIPISGEVSEDITDDLPF